MISTLLVFALSAGGMIDRATSHAAPYSAVEPTVKYGASGQSRVARNWYDHRPVGKLFTADEGGNSLPHVTNKGKL